MRYDKVSGQFLAYEKGGETNTTQTVQNFSPEEAAARAAVQAEAARIYNQTAGTIANSPYPGSVPVGPSAATTAGQTGTLAAANQVQGQIPGLFEAQQYGLSGVLDPNDPRLQASIKSAIRPVTEAYTDTGGVLSAIRSDLGSAGQYGSSRMGIGEGVAAGRYLNTIGDISAQRTQAAYDKGLDVMTRTMAMAPQTLQTAFMAPAAQSAVGNQQEQYQQLQNDFEAAKSQWELNAPWAGLQNYANVVYGGQAPGTTTTGNTPSNMPSPIMTGLGGAAMGASIGSAVMAGTATGASTGGLYGAAIGAAFGLISSYM